MIFDLLFFPILILLAGAYVWVRDTLLTSKRKKVKKILESHPTAIKLFMLQHDDFTYYDRVIRARIHNYSYIKNTSTETIDKDFDIKRCNIVISSFNAEKWTIWENNYNYITEINEKYTDGLINYIVENKLYRFGVEPKKVDDCYISCLPFDLLNTLASVQERVYRNYQEIEEGFFVLSNAKEEKTEFIKYLKENNIRYFYHFTDVRNLKSIIENGGLFSWYTAHNKGIIIPKPGGNALSHSLDLQKGLEDYVRLSFAQFHPMAHRLELEGAKNVILKIHPSVSIMDDTLFSNMNATSNACYVGNDLKALKRVNITEVNGIYKRTDKEFPESQAEVLVKRHIPLKYILNIDDFVNLI